jgi:hypothetical protein
MNPLQKQKKYGIRSSYLNIKNRSDQYNVNRSNVKTLKQIQTDEIERIIRINPEFFEFFEVFQHPTLQELKTFDLKEKTRLRIDETKFNTIKERMIHLFQQNLKGVRLLKISSEMIDSIGEIKKDLFKKLQPTQDLVQKSIFEKFKNYALQIKTKYLTKKKFQLQGSLNVKQDDINVEQVVLLTDIFSNIINILQEKEQTPINIALVVNKFFYVSISEIFNPISLPEFKRPPFSKLLTLRCRFNMLSLAVFLGIEPLIVFFILLGGDPSLKNLDPTSKNLDPTSKIQYHQDSSYQLLYFQMIFRNVAINVGWKPSIRSQPYYNSYTDPRIQKEKSTYDNIIQTLDSMRGSILNTENKKIFNSLLKHFQNKERTLLTSSEVKLSQSTANITVEQLITVVQDLKKKFEEYEQQQQQGQPPQAQGQPQQQQGQAQQQQQRQPQAQQQQQGQQYNFNSYLYSNDKLCRIITFLSSISNGIDLNNLVPQTDIAPFYSAGNQIRERVLSSILIAMSKDKYLNESAILQEKDPKYVKYSIYDLLRYFLIFNGFDIAKYFSEIKSHQKGETFPQNSSIVQRGMFHQNSSIPRGIVSSQAQMFGEQLPTTRLRQQPISSSQLNTILPRELQQQPRELQQPLLDATNIRLMKQQQLQSGVSSPNPVIPPQYKKIFRIISNINQTSKPFNYSFFFYLIANKDISIDHKIELCCIALLQGADPNIMPNIAQSLLSQIDPNLTLCDIFKMFLRKNDYEKAIKIFKLYSPNLFNKPEWDDSFGAIRDILKKQERNIKFLERKLLSSKISSDLRNRTDFNFSFLNEPQQLSMNLAPPPHQSILTTSPSLQGYYNPYYTGGSKIKLRTFHFLEPKSYNEHAFRAEKPIIAGKMAYDFLRTHYKLKKGSSIMFTIEDRIKDRKYNYIGEKINNKIIIKST